jgi:LDH2 family malate/lactate/ureidoglycolate dehydrogenase
MTARFRPADLAAFAFSLLRDAGLSEQPARAVADGLLEGDLLGHTTHGLALLPGYIEELDAGAMEKEGGPETIAGLGAVETWDGRRLPGVWLTQLAVARASGLARSFGIGAVAIRRSHHIACLAAFLEKPAREGLLTFLFSSDPSVAFVAPYNGTTPVMTPNPLAAGIPADPDPILIDISASITTAGMCARARAEGTRLPGLWLLTSSGQLTDDPHVMNEGGSILPIGGLDHGHKGYGLSLIVETLTQGLSGYGRAEQPREWGAGVLVLVFAPEAFGPPADFAREVNWLIEACRASAPRPGTSVRIPGEAAMARKRDALAHGVALHSSVLEGLRSLGSQRGCRFPAPL